MTDKVREAFEAHICDSINSSMGLGQALEKDADGFYKTTWVRTAWDGFQVGVKAGRESMREEAMKACDKEANIAAQSGRPLAAFCAHCCEQAIKELP